MQIATWLKSRRTSSLLLAAGISLSLFIAIFAIISAIQNRTYSTRAVDTTSTTPVATVSSVDIIQAGDGSSVTIAGDTLTETGDNTTRRKVLNNNKVVYRVNYNVQTVATFKIKFKMPANNVIDPSSISSGSVCDTGESSLSSAVSDNLHTGSDETSYTKNVATCVIKPDSTGSGSWTVTAYPWGGNGEKISPEVYVDDVAQATANTASANDPVTVIAKANYFLKPELNSGGNLSNRLITSLFFSAQIYGQTSNKQSNRSLGLEPLASSFTVDIDTSGLPSGWRNNAGDGRAYPVYFYCNSDTNDACQTHSGSNRLVLNDDRTRLLVIKSEVATGTRHYPTQNAWDGNVPNAIYGGFMIYFSVPYESVKDNNAMSITYNSVKTTTRSGLPAEIAVNGKRTLTSSVTNKATGRPVVRYGTPNGVAEAPGGFMYHIAGVTYPGEVVSHFIGLTSTSIENSYSSNVYVCVAWKANVATITSAAESCDSGKRCYAANGISTSKFEYGVGIDDSTSGGRPSQRSVCGYYGSGDVVDSSDETSIKFFTSFDDAERYANQNNRSINYLRIFTERTRADPLENDIARVNLKHLSASDGHNTIYFYSSAFAAGSKNDPTDTSVYEWSDDAGETSVNYIKSGLLNASLSASASTISPDNTATVSVTPRTWNNDTSAKITITLPKELSLKSGSIKRDGQILTKGTDYDVALNSDNTTTITLQGDSIAGEEPTGSGTNIVAKDGENQEGVARAPITFDVSPAVDATFPSTVAIKSVSSGDGTDFTADKFKQTSLNLSLVAPPKMFRYSLNADESSIYAGEDINYSFNISNTTGTATDKSGAAGVTVLPYNGDSRGTTGLGSYKIKDLALATNGTLADIYFTTSSEARKIDTAESVDVAKSLIDKVAWTKCEVVDDKCTNLPTNGALTALKIQTATMPTNGSTSVSFTMTDITPSITSSPAKIVSDIGYINSSLMTAAVQHSSQAGVDYLGDYLAMKLDKNNVDFGMAVNSYEEKNIGVDITAQTLTGYSINIDIPNNLVDGNKDFAATGSTPKAGQNGYAVKVDGGEWHGKSFSFAGISGNVSTTHQTTIGVGTAWPAAGTYTGKITYTLTNKI